MIISQHIPITLFDIGLIDQINIGPNTTQPP